MTAHLLATVDLDLQPQLQWIWYSDRAKAFISGDEKTAYSIATADPSSPVPLDASRISGASGKSACNLPITEALKDEFLSYPWRGLRFLERAAYDGVEADILRTLVFGPNYSVPMPHPPSGAIVGVRSNAIQLFARRAVAVFEPVDRTKPRGKAALAFAAHPVEAMIVYGDNAGTFTAHRFGPSMFGRAAKIADKGRKASQVEFLAGGATLLIGGMGYLATFGSDGETFSPRHEVSAPVRDFIVGNDGRSIFVNQGMHGVSVYRHDETGLTKQFEVKPNTPVQLVAASFDGGHVAVTHHGVAKVSVYSVR